MTSFGSGFIVQPNAIDFAFVFAKADFLSNPTLTHAGMARLS